MSKGSANRAATKAIEIRKEGGSASDDELANEMGISKEKLHKMMAEVSRSFLISLDELLMQIIQHRALQIRLKIKR